MGSHEDCRQTLNTVSITKLKPVIDSTVPFADISAAVARMKAGQQFGKIVIGISNAVC